MKYLQYLEAVQEETGDEYSEIAGLLERFRILTEAHADLTARQAVTVENTEAEKARVVALKQAKVNEMLRANNTMAALKKRYDAVVEDTNVMQHKVCMWLWREHAGATAVEVAREIQNPRDCACMGG